MGQKVPLLFLYKTGFGIKLPMNFNKPLNKVTKQNVNNQI